MEDEKKPMQSVLPEGGHMTHWLQLELQFEIEMQLEIQTIVRSFSIRSSSTIFMIGRAPHSI